MSLVKASKVSLMLMIILVFSKLVGFIRDMLLAESFGSGMETDAYFIAITASTIFFAIIGIALNTIIIPVISDIRENDGSSSELKYVNNMLHIVFLFTVVITCLGYIFAPAVIRVLASGFHGEKFDLAVRMTRIGMPIMIFNGFLSVMKGYLHVHEEFKIPALEGFVSNLPIIFYLMFFSDIYGITGLMVVVTGTWFLKVLLYLPASFKKGYRYRTVFSLKDRNFKRTLLLIGPIMLGIFSNYINLIVDRTIASRLIESSVSALSYADRVKAVTTELMSLTVTAVIYTMIAKYISNRNNKELVKTIKFGINVVLLITIPAAVGLIILSYPLTMLLFQRGSFTNADTLMTSSALSYYALGIVSIVGADLLSKVYFAKQDTRTPMVISISAVGMNIVLNIILAKFMGHNGLALATSITAAFSITALAVFLKKRLLDFKFRDNISVLIKSVLAAAVMGIIVAALNMYVFSTVTGSFIIRALNLGTVIAIGVISYGAMTYFLKIDEVVLGAKKVKEKIIKVLQR